MNELEFEFDIPSWIAYLNSVSPESKVSALHLLTLLEQEDDMAVEEAFAALDERKLRLDISDLPKPSYTGEMALRLKQECNWIKQGLSPQNLSENDPLRMYLEEIAMIPAVGEEGMLSEKLLQGEDGAMEQLTNLGLSRVVELAKKYVGKGVLLLDLIQEGSLGLWQAISSFSGGDYPLQRDYAICNAMAKAIFQQSKNNGVGQKMRDALSDYRSVDERLLAELGRNPSLEEIAQELHMSVEETQSVKKMLDDAYLLQQAKKQDAPPEEQEEENVAVEDTAYFQMRQRIQELLSVLPAEDAKILTLRFGLEKGLPLSPEETGRKLGLTTDEVTAREMRALSMLRTNERK